jgi:hypothetical protein
MELSQGELEGEGAGDTLISRPSEMAESSEDSDYDDLYPEDVTGALIGCAGILALVVLLAVAVSLSAATALLRHL